MSCCRPMLQEYKVSCVDAIPKEDMHCQGPTHLKSRGEGPSNDSGAEGGRQGFEKNPTLSLKNQTNF